MVPKRKCKNALHPFFSIRTHRFWNSEWNKKTQMLVTGIMTWSCTNYPDVNTDKSSYHWWQPKSQTDLAPAKPVHYSCPIETQVTPSQLTSVKKKFTRFATLSTTLLTRATGKNQCLMPLWTGRYLTVFKHSKVKLCKVLW